MIPYLWPCAPQTIYVDPTLPPAAIAAVDEWHDLYRPDWTFTSTEDGATIKVIRGGLEPPYAGYEYSWWDDADTIYKADVNVADDVVGDYAGDVVRHELEHVAGFEHTDDVPFMHGGYDGHGRYSLKDALWLLMRGRRCAGADHPTSLPHFVSGRWRRLHHIVGDLLVLRTLA